MPLAIMSAHSGALPDAISANSKNAITEVVALVKNSTRRRGYRSATTPANGEQISTGRAPTRPARSPMIGEARLITIGNGSSAAPAAVAE